jgi:hypothetical protein
VLVAVAAVIHKSQGTNSHHASCVARRTTLFSSASSGSILPTWGMRDLPTPQPCMVLTPTGMQTSVQQIMSPGNSTNLLCEMPTTAPIKSSPQAVQVCVLNILINLLFALHIMIFSLTTFFMFLNHLRTLLPFIVSPLIIMSFLNFILISFLLRIGNRGKLFFKASLEEGFILFLAAPHQLRPNKSSTSSRSLLLDGMPVLVIHL